MGTRKNYHMGTTKGTFSAELYGGDPLVSKILLGLAKVKPKDKYALNNAVEHYSRGRTRRSITLPRVSIQETAHDSL